MTQKGSLYVTRPTLNTYAAKREKLVAMANELFEVVTPKNTQLITALDLKYSKFFGAPAGFAPGEGRGKFGRKHHGQNPGPGPGPAKAG